MKIYQLCEEERSASGFTHRIKLTYADLTETGTNTAQTIALLTVPAGSLVTRVATRLVTAFENSADAAFNATTLIIGDGGSTNRFLTSQELNKNGTEVLVKAGTGTLYGYETADTIDAVFGSMSAKALNDLDTGEVWIFLQVQDLDNLINETLA